MTDASGRVVPSIVTGSGGRAAAPGSDAGPTAGDTEPGSSDAEQAASHAAPSDRDAAPLAMGHAASSVVADAGPLRPKGKGPGASCSSGQCAPGLSCCETGFHGHCGGAMPTQEELERNPCVVTSTCTPGPCRPMSFPP